MAPGSDKNISCPIFIFALIIRSAALLSHHAEYRIETIPLTGMFSDFSCTCIQQDSDGFMWFGSTNGLYRYDGTHLKVFRHIPYDSASLSSDHVLCLIEDREGNLWAGTRKGLNRYDKYSESFTCHTNLTGIPKRTGNRNIIDCIAEDNAGHLWLASYVGISRFDKATGTFDGNYEISRQGNTNNTTPLRAFGVDFFEGQNLLIADFEGGRYRYNEDTDHFDLIEPPGVVLYENQTGKFMLDRTGAVRYFNNVSQNFEDNKFKVWPQVITRDGSGNIWMRLMDGIYCNQGDLNPGFVWKYPEPYTSTPDYYQIVRILYIDNEGIVWFFTNNGIHKIIENYRNFRVYDSDPSNNSFVDCIYPESEHIIWFGALNGIYSLDRRSGTFTLHYGVPWDDSAHPNAVRSMFPDRSGKLWVGMTYEGLFSLAGPDEEPFQIERHSAPDMRSLNFPGAPWRNIGPFFEDSQGRLWVGSSGGLYIFNRQENRFITVDLKPAGMEGPELTVHIRHETGSQDLVATGLTGIYLIKPPLNAISETKQEALNVYPCRQIAGDGSIKPFPALRTTFMDSRGHLWLGSDQNGLMQIQDFEKQLGSGFDLITVNYTMEDGLPSNCIYSLIEDDHGDLWMGTENGLSKFDTELKHFTNYSVRHGLPINLFRTESVAKGTDGELFFGTRKGMIAFHPDSMHINRKVPAVVITSFRLFNETIQPGEESVLKKSIARTDRIALKHNQNSLSFEFASLNFIQPELNQYRYYLEGYEREWIYSGNRNSASYTNLKPGEYVFRATGSNNDGIWNEEGAALEISIYSPPWITWYGYLVYIAIAAGIAFWIYRYLYNRTKMRLALEVERVEKEKMRELDTLKTRFFANISHEFRTPLTLILGPVEDYLKRDQKGNGLKTDVVQLIHRNAMRLQRLINQLLDLAKLETGKFRLRVSEGNMEDFTRAIILSFLSLAESKKILYEYELPGEKTGAWFDSDKLEKILVNLISNAFKFTPEQGRVKVRYQYLIAPGTDYPEWVEISVSDTGSGIRTEYQGRIFDRFYQVSDSQQNDNIGTGIGLALVKELVEIYRGEISVESQAGVGSTFYVKLPVAKDKFMEEELTGTLEAIEGIEAKDLSRRPGMKQQGAKMTGRGSALKDAPLILVVEDNEDLVNYISGILDENFKILTAQNGLTGMKIASETIPDLIITDLMMPEMDGMEMCERIRQDEKTKHIPVIMLTARADRESKLEGLETGADNYLIKPFDAEELLVRIRNLIEQRRKLREKFRREILAESNLQNIQSPDDQLLKKILDMINNHLAEPDFTVEQMSDNLNMSRVQLYRKIKALTGYSPMDLLRTIRLARAASLFDNGFKNVAQVMYQVGFNSQSYFAQCFRRIYQVNPSEYLKKNIR